LVLAGCASLAPRHEIVAYYPAWKGAIEFDARMATVVNYAFLEVASDGALALSQPAIDAGHFTALRNLRSKHPHLRLVASVGGWTRSDRFSDMAHDPAMRERFVRSSVAFLRAEGFDGLDIDWEYPGAIGIPCTGARTCDRPQDKGNFVILARELRTAFDAAGAADGKRYLLTIAAGNDGSFLFDGGSSAWMAELASILDWINLMTYDYHGTWETRAGMLAPLLRDPADPSPTNVDASVSLYLAAGVPARKLTLGIPLYAKGWTGCAPGPSADGLYQACTAALPDPVSITAPGLRRHWNADARVPYSYDAASGTFVTYDDERSIDAKLRYLARRGLLGAMFWEIAADREGRLVRKIGTLPH
jgi:chitinase